jgi:hypothetical protein
MCMETIENFCANLQLIFVGLARSVCHQIPYIRMPPAPSLCGMLLCCPWRVDYSQQLSTPPPLHALQLAYQPLHPICNFFDNRWFSKAVELWLRIAQKNTARIRRIYENTPYIAVYTPYKYVYTEFGYGGGRLENTAYMSYRIIHITIRIWFWPTLHVSNLPVTLHLAGEESASEESRVIRLRQAASKGGERTLTKSLLQSVRYMPNMF